MPKPVGRSLPRSFGKFTDDPNGVEARSFHATELKAALTFWGWVCPSNDGIAPKPTTLIPNTPPARHGHQTTYEISRLRNLLGPVALALRWQSGQRENSVSVPSGESVLRPPFRSSEKAHPSHAVAMVTATSSVN
jgi:hypothetical protein